MKNQTAKTGTTATTAPVVAPVIPVVANVAPIQPTVLFDMEKRTVNGVTCKSKSEMFRKMYDAGMEVADISRETKSHYSFVHTIIHQGCKVRTVEKVSKVEQIKEMLDAGKKASEIAKELDTNQSYVYTISKKYKEEKEALVK